MAGALSAAKIYFKLLSNYVKIGLILIINERLNKHKSIRFQCEM